MRLELRQLLDHLPFFSHELCTRLEDLSAHLLLKLSQLALQLLLARLVRCLLILPIPFFVDELYAQLCLSVS